MTYHSVNDVPSEGHLADMTEAEGIYVFWDKILDTALTYLRLLPAVVLIVLVATSTIDYKRSLARHVASRAPAAMEVQMPQVKITPCKANEWVDGIDLINYLVDFPVEVDLLVKVNGVEQTFRMPRGGGTYKFPTNWRVISVKFPFDFPLKQVSK